MSYIMGTSISNDPDNEDHGVLPYRPEMDPIESGRGYLIRVADELSCAASSITGGNVPLFPSKDYLQPLAKKLRMDVEQLGRHFYSTFQSKYSKNPKIYCNFYDHKILKVHFDINYQHVCPLCLEEGIVASGMWDLAFVTACLDHRRMLIGKCPDCGHYLSWTRSSLLSCKCGYDLRFAVPEPASNAQLAIVALIYYTAQREVFPKERLNEFGNFVRDYGDYLCGLLEAIRSCGYKYGFSGVRISNRYISRESGQAKRYLETAYRFFTS